MDYVISPKQLRAMIPAMIDADVSLMVWGAPGIGKTAVVSAAAEDCGRDLRTLPLPAMDAVDLHGAPVVTAEDGLRYLDFVAPRLLPRPGDAPSVLFLDEINAASPSLQPICYSLLWGRRIGDYQLPENCYVMAAGNRQQDRAVAHRLSSALALRMCHVDVEPRLTEIRELGLANGWAVEVLAYLTFRPEHLHDFDPASRASPNPRQWEQVSDVLGQRARLNGTLGPAIAGLVGTAVGAEVMSFLDMIAKLPSPDAVLLNPGGVEIPGEASARLALALAVTRATQPDSMGQCMEFLRRLPKELEALGAKSLSNRNDCTATRPWVKWCAENPNIFEQP